MTRTERIGEMMTTMTSFQKEKYQKNELLAEMFALQQEIVELTFDGVHASMADLKIWDVERHLEQLNQDCDNVADEELQRFRKGSRTLSNLIKAEISGNRGEAKAFRTLQFIQSKNIVLKNVELSNDKLRTELDAVVITPKAISIIEVKNTSKNIFIDENGEYFRTGEFLKRDCNIAEKMIIKEELLRKVLLDTAIKDIPIRSVVVFTDNRIEVQNKYSRVKTCFVSQLAYIIDGFESNMDLTDEEMKHIEGLIKNAECKEAYPFEFDVVQYKLDFATVMTVLEEASEKEKMAVYGSEEVIEEKKADATNGLKEFFTSRYVGYASGVATAAVVAFVSAMAVGVIKKGGVRR